MGLALRTPCEPRLSGIWRGLGRGARAVFFSEMVVGVRTPWNSPVGSGFRDILGRESMGRSGEDASDSEGKGR